jgi:CspA family cold shock protein
MARHYFGGGGNFGEIGVANGTLKWFNQTRGHGFIRPDDGGSDVFVHVSAVEKAGNTGLAEGARISYELVPDRRGTPAAQNLHSRGGLLVAVPASSSQVPDTVWTGRSRSSPQPMPLARAFRSPPDIGMWMMRGDILHHPANSAVKPPGEVGRRVSAPWRASDLPNQTKVTHSF